MRLLLLLGPCLERQKTIQAASISLRQPIDGLDRVDEAIEELPECYRDVLAMLSYYNDFA